MISGLLARKFGAKNIATIALLLSCLCCLLSPLFIASTKPVLIPFLFFWCMVVVADSPMFSSLVAQHAPPDSRGSALTIVNCIGFTITIVSIQLMTLLGAFPMTYVFMFLAIGPILGLFALLWKRNL
jgi:MFS family permease